MVTWAAVLNVVTELKDCSSSQPVTYSENIEYLGNGQDTVQA